MEDDRFESILVMNVTEALELLYPRGLPDRTLLHVNCEGCEYNVIPLMPLENITYVQIGTHMGTMGKMEAVTPEAIQGSITQYCALHLKLFETHRLVFGLPWVWERWERRSWKYVGCFVDVIVSGNLGSEAALLTLETPEARHIFESDDVYYKYRDRPFETCKRAASFLQVRFFSLQDGGWCCGTNNQYFGQPAKNPHHCIRGLGGPYLNDVYEFTDL